MHPSTAAILRYFEYSHLPPDLQDISRPIGDLANEMALRLDGPELTAGLRKLLEAKDCLVRAALDQRVAQPVTAAPNPRIPGDFTQEYPEPVHPSDERTESTR